MEQSKMSKAADNQPPDEEEEEVKHFQCENCSLTEKYKYFGREPPFYKKYKLLEKVYVIEDPFQPPNKGEILIMGSHCMKCGKCVCKDVQCSFYYDGTYCLPCAKNFEKSFPQPVQEKLNRIIVG